MFDAMNNMNNLGNLDGQSNSEKLNIKNSLIEAMIKALNRPNIISSEFNPNGLIAQDLIDIDRIGDKNYLQNPVRKNYFNQNSSSDFPND